MSLNEGLFRISSKERTWSINTSRRYLLFVIKTNPSISVKKPLHDCKIVIISTGGIILKEDKPFDLKVLKADVHIYMDSDDELQKADQKVAYLKQVVNYLEQVLRSINNRTFLIKNAIEWKKFTSGAI